MFFFVFFCAVFFCVFFVLRFGGVFVLLIRLQLFFLSLSFRVFRWVWVDRTAQSLVSLVY